MPVAQNKAMLKGNLILIAATVKKITKGFSTLPGNLCEPRNSPINNVGVKCLAAGAGCPIKGGEGELGDGKGCQFPRFIKPQPAIGRLLGGRGGETIRHVDGVKTSARVALAEG